MRFRDEISVKKFDKSAEQLTLQTGRSAAGVFKLKPVPVTLSGKLSVACDLDFKSEGMNAFLLFLE